MKERFTSSLIILSLILLFAIPAMAAGPIYVENHSFELPGTIKYKNFEEVPGWSTDTICTDSGVEQDANAVAPHGSWSAFQRSSDPAMWQLTDHVLEAGEVLYLMVDGRITWAATKWAIVLYYDEAGARVVAAADTVDIAPDWTKYTLKLVADDVPEAIGKQIGILFDNVSEGDNWIGLDNVRLSSGNEIIAIDAEMDDFYTSLMGPDEGAIKLRAFQNSDNGAPMGDADLSASIYVAWDEDFFYLYEEVKDDKVLNTSSNVWENDCLELKIDGVPDDSTQTAVSFDTRLTIIDSSESTFPTDELSNIADSLKLFARRKTADGYAMELAISWEALGGTETITPAVDNVFGMAIGQHDNDSDHREASLQWSAVLLDAIWNTPKYHGTVKFLPDNKLQLIPTNNMTGVTNELPYDGSLPEGQIVIDAEKDAFYKTLNGPDDGFLQLKSYAFSDNGIPKGDDDLSANIWFSWDEDWLYIYEEVTDDTISADGTQNSWESYLTDCLELKVDPIATDSVTNSIWDTRLTIFDSSETDAPTDQLSSVPDSLKMFARKLTSNGYAMEMAIAWDAIGSTEKVSVGVDSVFGMGIGVHDNDGNARQASIQWAAVMLDAIWNTPKYLGTVKFLEDNKLQFLAQNNIVDLTNDIPYDGTPFHMRVDGLMDPFYYSLSGPDDGFLQIQAVHNSDNGAPDNDNDLSSKVWTAWDDEWFYLYEEVKDDIVTVGTTSNVWEVDCFEIKVDGVADDSTQSASSFETRVTALDTSEADGPVDQLSNIDDADKKLAKSVSDNGYIIELAIKWSALGGTETITPGVDNVFGMALANHDNDGAARVASIQWSAVLLDAVWNTPKYHGTVKFLADNKLEFDAKNNMTGVVNEIPYTGVNPTALEMEIDSALPTDFNLNQNYPNPFNPTTTISYGLPEAVKAKLVVYDILGRRVATLVDKKQAAGYYKVTFDASNLASGIYFCRIQAGKNVVTKKMTLLK